MLQLTRLLRGVAAPVVAAALLAACTPRDQGTDLDPDQVDAMAPPPDGACRVITPDDVAQPSNATRTVDCAEPHSAQTYAVGTLPDQFATAAYNDPDLAVFAFQTCTDEFEKFLGADESLAMRTVVSWAWFRPSKQAWTDGARWYRCDVVGGGPQSKEYVDLPPSARNLLRKRADEWLACVNGPSVNGAKVGCDQPHIWRAVTTIKLGQPVDPYPGNDTVKTRSRDFCQESVGAWLNYPPTYDFGYTWFQEGEWTAGNRRSICWAKTDQ